MPSIVVFLAELPSTGMDQVDPQRYGMKSVPSINQGQGG
jgi:hypothetical protein